MGSSSSSSSLRFYPTVPGGRGVPAFTTTTKKVAGVQHGLPANQPIEAIRSFLTQNQAGGTKKCRVLPGSGEAPSVLSVLPLIYYMATTWQY